MAILFLTLTLADIALVQACTNQKKNDRSHAEIFGIKYLTVNNLAAVEIRVNISSGETTRSVRRNGRDCLGLSEDRLVRRTKCGQDHSTLWSLK